MTLLHRCVIALLAITCLTAAVHAKPFTLILAADMADISDATSGRYAELKKLLDERRHQEQPVFFVFGGGSIGPSAMSIFDRGSHIIDILNSLEPDVMTVTKREFSYSEDELSLRAYEAAFPIVTSNVLDKRFSKTPDGLVDAVIVEKNGIKIGILSILNERVIEEYLLKQVTMLDPRQVALEAANTLRSQGADFVLLHYSFPFAFVSEFLDNAIIDIAFMSDTRLQEKYQTAHTHSHDLLLERPGTALIAEFDIADKQLSLTKKHSEILSAKSPDTSVQLQVDSYQLRLNRLLDERIGTWKTAITTKRPDVRGKENKFANFITDTMRAYAETDIALLNGGGLRGDTTYPVNTTITRRNIATELPFRSRLVHKTVTGQQIMEALENGLSQVEFLKGGFPHTSGMQLQYDSSAPPGLRVKSVEINGKPIDLRGSYSLATTDYIINGGDGYTSLMGDEIIDPYENTGILVSDLIVQSIRIQGGVDIDYGTRIQDLAGTN